MPQTFPVLTPTNREIPNIGNWKGKVGGIRRMIAQPCSPTAQLSVLAMWHAAPLLIWSLFGPDCIDMVADRAGGGHRRRRGLRWKEAGIIPDANTGTGLRWATFALGSLAQRAGWYFAIVDAGTDFAINWMSLAMIYDGCAGSGKNYANGTTRPEGFNLLFPGDWHALGGWEWHSEGLAAFGPSVVVPDDVDFSGTVGGNVERFPGLDPPNNVDLRVHDIVNDRTYWEGSGDPIPGGDKLTFGGFYEGTPLGQATTLQAQYKMSVGGVFRGTFNVGGIQLPNDFPSIFGAPCAATIETDKTWSDYWEEFLELV